VSKEISLQEEKLVLTSIIMQMSLFCKPDLDHLSPAIKDFLEGTMEEYADHEDEELVQRLVYYANEVLETDKESLH